ncbi:MAG: inositol monophosphatase family protein [Verrucomicrobiota bacterium]
MNLSNLQTQATKAARAAHETLLNFTQDAGIVSNAGKDIKTLADEAAQQAIFEHLRPTGIHILSEEDPASHTFNKDTPLWIVDPLDGTMNFSRQFPVWCISIALWQQGEPKLGIILDPLNGNLFSGSVEQNAANNENPIQVSTHTDPAQAVLATGFPSKRDFSEDSLNQTARFNARFKKIRMIGSAALSLAYVAQGTFDLYYEQGIWLWDVAAGLAIVKAAGGEYIISNLTDDLRATVIAGPKSLVDEARQTRLLSQ